MPDTVEVINIIVCGTSLFVVGLGLLLNLSLPYTDRFNRRFFTLFFTVLILYIGSMLLSMISMNLLDARFLLLSQVSMFLQSLFSSLPMPLLAFYLFHCVGDDPIKTKLLYFTVAFWLIYFALLLFTLFSKEIYYFTADNHYHRGPLYPLLLLPPLLQMLLNLVAVFRRWKRMNPRLRKAYLVFLLLPLGCLLLQMLFFGPLFIVIGTSIAALFLFFYILQDQLEHYVAQREELSRQKASIQALEMRPHFICNTMTSIYYLIEQDPDLARQVTLDFTTYLRKNFTALAREDMIPFTEELEHTRAYLGVEKMRFEGQLSVTLDTPFTDFRLPPLTLQPVVENAVKHGVSPEVEPLEITLRTGKENDTVWITVEDNGPGYVPADDEEPHIGLANIRERLEHSCGGTLSIEPRPSGGTRVTIRLPHTHTHTHTADGVRRKNRGKARKTEKKVNEHTDFRKEEKL